MGPPKIPMTSEFLGLNQIVIKVEKPFIDWEKP
jgi:hypothetical protein